MDVYERRHDEYTISSDPARFDVDVFHRYLSEESYWARGRERSTTDLALETSMVLGVYAPDGAMVGAARIVTDWITFGWLCDLFVLEQHRGRGLGKALVAATMEHPQLSRLKRFILATGDAHTLYAGYGFAPLADPASWMEHKGPIV